jgi:acyl-CoA thioester hydrolase
MTITGMQTSTFKYPIIIKEVYLDTFGHMNNAIYLTLFEEARWEFITQNGYGVSKIKETGLGPTIIEVTLKYLKELRLREEVIIESQLISYEKKIGKIRQNMIRAGELCCSAEFVFGLFNLKKRKLILPTHDWLKAVGVTTIPHSFQGNTE